MRVIQYRFSPNDGMNASRIGDVVESFFSKIDRMELMALYASKISPYVHREKIDLNILGSTVSESFRESYSSLTDYRKLISLKSTSSCRFIVFEDDGLLRICYSSEDDPLDFSELQPEISDASELLISTDLFDYL